MVHYVGILDGSHRTWGVRIPDAPGCHGGGATPEAAISDAVSALAEYAAELRKRSASLPKARSLKEILSDPQERPKLGQGESSVIIPLLLDKGRTIRANLTLDAGLLEEIDAEAALRGLTRSAFLASAARDKIKARG
jgi:predicted RNase H-like HicB family nuclease